MITAFVPIRKGSQRVKNKNFREFSDFQFGIYELKINQLISCTAVDKIIVSTTDTAVFEVGIKHPKLEIVERPCHLGLDATKTDDLVAYALDIVNGEWFLWTHVTSPIFDDDCYERFLEQAVKAITEFGYDSAVTVTALRGYLFDKDFSPLFKRSDLKWPATQSLDPVYEVNNAAFFGRTETLRKFKDRVGENPYFYECGKLEATDIDWEEDFFLAEIIYNNKFSGGR